MDKTEAIKVLECMAIDLVGALGGLSKTNPLTDVLQQRIEAINEAQLALRCLNNKEVNIHYEK